MSKIQSSSYDVQLKQLELTWKTFDINGDGTITLEEFTQFMHNRKTKQQLGHYSLNAIRNIFDQLDKNGNGVIELFEFTKHLTVDMMNKVYLDFLPEVGGGKRTTMVLESPPLARKASESRNAAIENRKTNDQPLGKESGVQSGVSLAKGWVR